LRHLPGAGVCGYDLAPPLRDRGGSFVDPGTQGGRRAIRLGQQLPEVNVVVLIVLGLTVVPVVVAQRLTLESGLLRRG
jgi:hypothetical protein